MKFPQERRYTTTAILFVITLHAVVWSAPLELKLGEIIDHNSGRFWASW